MFLLTLAVFSGLLHHGLRSDRPLFIAPPNPAYAQLRYASLAQVQASLRLSDVVLVDARPPEAYSRSTIPGSRNVPLHSTLDQAALTPLREARQVIVFCSNVHCNASKELAVKLKARGLPQVEVFSGGVSAWRDKGLPLQPGR